MGTSEEAAAVSKGRRRRRREKPDNRRYVSTGSTLLNLAISDNPFGGYRMGGIQNVIGDSSAGKTFGCLSTLAEAAIDPEMDDYELIYDFAEERNDFNMEYLFGDLINRIRAPTTDSDGDPENSHTMEDFEDNVKRLIKSGKKFIYVLDSMDSLDCEADIKKADEHTAAREKARAEGKAEKEAGSYGMAKAKMNSQLLRRLCAQIKKTDSLLIIISQTRDKIGLSFVEKTRAGGHALKFYSNIEMWYAIRERIKRKDIKVGVRSRVKVKKNSVTGKERDVDFEIFYDYGIDDIGSCVDYLVKMGRWKKVKSTIDATELGFKGTRIRVIQHIEEEPERIRELREMVGEEWTAFEDSLKSNRRRRY
jgi:RecA/RadA recombinase